MTQEFSATTVDELIAEITQTGFNTLSEIKFALNGDWSMDLSFVLYDGEPKVFHYEVGDDHYGEIAQFVDGVIRPFTEGLGLEL